MQREMNESQVLQFCSKGMFKTGTAEKSKNMQTMLDILWFMQFLEGPCFTSSWIFRNLQWIKVSKLCLLFRTVLYIHYSCITIFDYWFLTSRFCNYHNGSISFKVLSSSITIKRHFMQSAFQIQGCNVLWNKYVLFKHSNQTYKQAH